MSKTIDLEGRTYIVGGAGGGGLGTAICTMLAEAGAFVVGVDVTELGRSTAEEALAAAGGRYLVLDADLTDPDAVATAVERAGRDGGPVSGAVNVVGGMLPNHWIPLIDRTTPQAFEESLNLNLKPALITSTAVARAVRTHGQGGSIVNISSTVGLISMAYGAGYGAAKAALINLTRTMAVEWGRFQLRVNAIAPGTIRARKLGRARFDKEESEELRQKTREVVPLGRRGVPEDIAGAALFLLSDLSAYVTGQVLAVDGGAVARAPFNDGDDLPVFVTDPAMRQRIIGGRE